MKQHTTDDVAKLLHITIELLVNIEARIHALERGQLIDLTLTNKLSEEARRAIQDQLKSLTDQERARISEMVAPKLPHPDSSYLTSLN